uniref:Chloride channel CLIC-like protein 1 n=1 Tax=Cuerna arida TaxID=1464854 RepID=A0A1B6EIG5_9HEMI
MSFYYALTIVFLNCILNTNCYSELGTNEIADSEENTYNKYYPRMKPGWVDPFDMLGDNRDTGDLFTLGDVQNQQLKIRAELCHTHLLKFINLLRRAIESHNPTDSVNLVKLEFIITEEQLKILKEFGKDGSNGPRLETVSEVLYKLFTTTDYGRGSKNMSNYKLLQWLQNAFVKIINSPEWTVVVSVSVMLLSTLWLVYKSHSYRLALFSVFLTIFFAGFGFTWMRMYEEKEAEVFHDSVKYGNAPYHCTGNELLWYEHIYYRMFGADCLQFYKTRNVRPIVKVSPTEVFAETLSTMLINPASNIGTSYGNFIHSVSSAVPFWLEPIALGFAFVMPPVVLLILLVFYFRYQMSFSITGFHFTPSCHQKSYNEVSNQSSQYVEDISRKEDERYQKNSVPQDLLSDNTTPLFLVNWLGLKKLITDVKVTDENEVKSLTDTENQNNTISDDAKSKDVQDEELEGVLPLVKKQICKIRSRGILTIGERSSSVTNENDELVDPAVSQASGDHSGSVTICDKKIQCNEKRT